MKEEKPSEIGITEYVLRMEEKDGEAIGVTHLLSRDNNLNLSVANKNPNAIQNRFSKKISPIEKLMGSIFNKEVWYGFVGSVWFWVISGLFGASTISVAIWYKKFAMLISMVFDFWR